MLRKADTLRQLRFSELMAVYLEGNQEKAMESGTLLDAEQDFYQYLQEVFFQTDGACYYVWEEAGRYISALRMEPYRDGWLLAALETRPQERRKGFAAKLVTAVLNLPEYHRVYSHIHRSNWPSLALHESCGFRKILDYSVYIDGSVNRHTVTYLYEKDVSLQ